MFRLVFLAFHGPVASVASARHEVQRALAPQHSAPSTTAHPGGSLARRPAGDGVAPLIVLRDRLGRSPATWAAARLGGSDWFEHFLEPSFSGARDRRT